MVEPVVISTLNQVGRVTVRDPNLPQVYVTNNTDFTVAASYSFDFSLNAQRDNFGIVKGVFIDNGRNPSNVEIQVSGTDQFFTVPANSMGYYHIDAQPSSKITLTSDGGATDYVTTTFYNWEVAPSVWYEFGTLNTDKPIKVQGAMPEGADIATENDPNPVYIGGKGPTGELVAVKVDALGRLDFSASITVGGVFGADPMGAGPINPGVVQAVKNSAGNLVYVTLNAAGEFTVHDADGLAQLVIVNTNLVTIIASLASIDAELVTANATLSAIKSRPATGANTSVVAATVSTSVLASNADRKGATIYNDSYANLFLLLKTGGTASATVFTARLEANAYYELPFGYTGAVIGIWDVASGNARVMEFT